jgi:hypothetical protein
LILKFLRRFDKEKKGSLTLIDILEEKEKSRTIEEKLHEEVKKYEKKTKNLDYIRKDFKRVIEEELGGEEKVRKRLEEMFQ